VASMLLPRLRPGLLPSWQWPTEHVGRAATLLALAVLAVGAAPVYDRIGLVADEGRLETLPAAMRTAEMRLFAPNVARVLRDLPPESVVLADPRTRNGFIAMSIAPVYVVSSVPRHTAATPANRVDERFQTALDFFDKDLDE